MYCWNCGNETPFGGFFCPSCHIIKAQVETTRAVESLAAYPLAGVGVSDISFLARDLAAVGYDLEAAIEYHISRVVDRLIQIQEIEEEILAEERKQTYYLGELLNAIRAPVRTKVSEQIQIAQHQADVGFQAEALQRLDDAEREFPIDPRIYFLRTTIFQRQNKPNVALNEIGRGVGMIIPEHPGDTHSPEHDYDLRAKALFFAAQIAHQQNNPQKAVGFCRRVERYQLTLEERVTFATYLADAGETNKAIAELDDILLSRSKNLIPTDLSRRFPSEDEVGRLFSIFSAISKQPAFKRKQIRRFLNKWYVKAQRTTPWLGYIGLVLDCLSDIGIAVIPDITLTTYRMEHNTTIMESWDRWENFLDFLGIGEYRKRRNEAYQRGQKHGRIFDYLFRHEATKKEIARDLNIPYSAVHDIVMQALPYGSSRREGRARLWETAFGTEPRVYSVIGTRTIANPRHQRQAQIAAKYGVVPVRENVYTYTDVSSAMFHGVIPPFREANTTSTKWWDRVQNSLASLYKDIYAFMDEVDKKILAKWMKHGPMRPESYVPKQYRDVWEWKIAVLN